MKKKVFSLMMMLVFAFIGLARAEEVTVYEGTATNNYVPAYVFYFDDFTRSQYVIPAADLAAVNGGTITSVKFYTTSNNMPYTTVSTVDVYLKEVDYTTISAFEAKADCQVVYTGTLEFVTEGDGGTCVITFSTPFTYNGGNLLVGCENTTDAGYKNIYFYGQTVSDASVAGYNASSLDNVVATQRNFIPKTTFTYNGGGGGGGGTTAQLFALQDGEVVETVSVGVRPNGCWMEPFTFQIRNDGGATTLSLIDFTPRDYFTVVGPELPVQVAHNGVVDVQLTTGTSTNTDWQMVAIYGTGRTARVWNITADPYNPETPDVWELACQEATSFPFVEVPATAHNTTLHNDYTLPFPEIPEGYDAVYKLVFAEDQMLDAEVTYGSNGKVALYTQDFYGQGGPMADNYYVGFGGTGGGGSTGAPFEAMIGDETSTTYTAYMPFYTLYNYSISEALFTAAELAEAGVTTASMTSLSWEAIDVTTTQPQNNISIWMANVEDTELTTTSHNAAEMTLVYTGNIATVPPMGWNEFVFNEGNFAWDGVSNVLILCQRNNGQWSGHVNWRSHNPGFYGMTYKYQDSTPYDAMTQTYAVTRSNTSRPNTMFKSTGRNRDEVLFADTFEAGDLSNWTLIDADNDGDGWQIATPATYGIGDAHSGSYCASSWSWNSYSMDPDNYMISPLVDGASSITYYVATNTGYPDHYAVMASTTGNAISNFVTVFEEDAYRGGDRSGVRSSMTQPGTRVMSDWAVKNITLPAGTKYVAFRHYNSYDMNYLFIDDVTIYGNNGTPTPPPGPTPPDPPTPPTPTPITYSAGPVITDMPVAPGTYYLVASSTDPDFEVTINAEAMPCPDVDNFVFSPTPADNEDEVEPASVTLRWMIPTYATGWRIIFGSTYYPDPNHPQTVMYPADGSFTNQMANSYTVRNLWNNTNYFWHVEFNNDGCPAGVSSPIWGFTTHLNIPQGLTADDETVFNDETITLSWNAVVDRTFRTYFIYRDGVKIGETTTNNIGATTYTDGPLAYNMTGYTYYVTSVYDEGESAPSNTVNVKVSGRGSVNGHVYEQDGTTGIANATVTMVGTDEFGDSHTYTATTNASGYYTATVYAGEYNGSAYANGYFHVDEPIQGNPINVAYNATTSPIDYMMDENFDPVCAVIAQYYPDSLNPDAPYVKVYWGCGLPGSDIIEDFETGDFSLFDWQVDPSYPWSITTNNPYEGTYCMKSGGAGVANVISNMTVTVDIPADGLMSFFGKISCENNWDYGYFYIDGTQRGSYTGAGNWTERTFDITQGTHTFQWQYTKDSSVNSNDDCFYVDYINFYKQPEPALPGMTYDFENSTMQGWTSVDADGDGYGWYVASEIMSTGYGHNGSNDCVLSQSYNNTVGILYPDNYLVSPQVQLGGVLRFYACAQDASYAAEHFGVAVSTTNTNPSSFTMLQEWTMSAKSISGKKVAEPAADVRAIGASRDGNNRAQGEWYEYTVDLSAYSGNGYVAIRHFNCSDMFYLDVDDITISEPSKGIADNTRRFSHYRVYRTNCYNDGPYTLLDETQNAFGNTRVLACEVTDTVFIDTYWNDPMLTPPGVYKWGVGVVYVGNRGEEFESEISWSEPVSVAPVAPETSNRDMTFDFENGQIPADWTNSATYPWIVSSDTPTGSYCIKSSNSGVASSTSSIQTTVDFGEAGTVSYDALCQGEGTSTYWDHCDFSIDGTVMFTAGANVSGWNHYSFPVSAGTHTFIWSYTKDSTVNPTGDAFSIDNVAFSGNGGGGGGGAGDQPTVNGGTEPVQEPRESVIVWSNCLDKNMYLAEGDVTINVLLNSADNPEGISVKFVNINDVEQDLYPIADVILDETGFYAYPEFRKGDYNLTIEKEGYYTIEEAVSIWDPVDLRYVMTEILYGIDNLYVSRTGWAMWDDSHNNPGGGPTPGPGPGPGPGGSGDTFSVNFDDGQMPAGWTTIDANNDGYNWVLGSQIGGIYLVSGASLEGAGHNSSADLICSGSYSNATSQAITPDNYLVSPQVTLAAGSTFSFWACAQDASYAAEHFGVFISDNGTSNWTAVQEWTMTAKGGGAMSIGRGGETRAQGTWHQYTVDLSSFAGQKYIAIRHFNCNDQFILDVDDIELTAGSKSGDDRHLEYYKVMCTSIDGEPIFNTNSIHPFCQLATDELVEGERYICKVASMYSTGMSEWTEVMWQYESCEHYADLPLVESETTNDGNLLTWDGGTPGPGPGPGPGGSGDTFSVNFDNSQMPAGWTTIDANNDGYNWVLGTQVGGIYLVSGASLEGTGHNSSTDLICSGSYSNATSQAITPDNYLVSPQVTLAAGSTFSFWACAQDASYAAEHFGVFISDNGTSNWTAVQEWTMTAKGGGAMSIGRDGETRAQGTWRQYTVDLSSFAGQKYIAIRHFNCNDQFILDVDDIELTAGAKDGRAAWSFFNGYVTDPGAMANGADASWTKNGQATWGPNVNNGGGYMLADMFTLDATTTINEIEVYAYQTGSSTTSTFTGLYAQIFNGSPMSGGTAVWGDMTSNIMTGTAFTNCYRGSDGETTATTRPIMSITASGLNIELGAGTYYLVFSLTGSGSSGPWGAPHAEPSVGNTGNGLQYTTAWQTLVDSGTSTPYGCSMKLTGNTGAPGPGPGPGPTPEGVLGYMIFRDGEWLAELPGTATSFLDMDEYGDHTYLVRVIYGGTAILPDNNYWYAMSCGYEVEVGGEITCDPGAPIHAELLPATDQVKVWWGTEPAAPISEWLYYDDGEMAGALGAGGAIYWAVMFPANSLAPYAGTSLTQIAVMEYNAGGSYTANIYLGGDSAPQTLVSTQTFSTTGTVDWKYVTLDTPVAVDGTQNVWITMYQAGIDYPATGSVNTGDPNGRWVSVDGNQWIDVTTAGNFNYTWMIRGFVTNQAKGGSTVALPGFKGEVGGELSNVTVTPVAPAFAPLNRAEIMHYNVYRSTEATSGYTLLGEVAEDGSGYYEYIDTPGTAGTYYYQVTAVYDNDCESIPAPAFDNPRVKYLSVNVDSVGDAVNENSDNVALFPNPTNGNVTIQASGMNRIMVVSVLGQVVYDTEVSADEFILNMSQFNAGMFMVNIYTESGVTVKRVTVMQ